MPAPIDPPSSSTADQEILRKALARASRYVKVPGILALIPSHERHGVLGERALRNFINGETKSLTKEHYDVLARAWLETPLGRALRNLDATHPPAFDLLMGRLANGNRSRPAHVAAEGAFFMYHGSYIRPRHYVVRALTVRGGDDRILTVTDTIRDEITLGARNRTASGVLIFVDELPQVLLYGEENKRGLSLIVGSEIDAPAGALAQVFGTFIVKRAKGEAAVRHCLLVRQADGDPEAMIAETGIFNEAEIKVPERAQHRRAFDLLKRLATAEPFADPVLTYGE